MKRRDVLAVATTASLLASCLWQRFFDLRWEEELQLHDGRVIVVTLKYTYERLGDWARLHKYGPSILRETTLAFDAGQNHGVVVQTLKRQRPLLLGTDQQNWFLVIEQVSGMTGVEAGQDWGIDQNGHGQRVAVLKDGRFWPVAMALLPEQLTTPNFLLGGGHIEELAEFNDKRVSLAEKSAYLAAHSLDPIHRTIQRPRAATSKP